MKYVHFLPFVVFLLLFSACKSKTEVAQPVYELAPPDNAADIVREAGRWIGVPYKYAGEDRDGVDCSGFVMQVYLKAKGIKLPRDSRSQKDYCLPIEVRDLLPSDLLFFSSKTGGDRVSHVGIYIGNGDFIHASGTKGVMISNLREPYYMKHFHSCGRVPQMATQLPK